MEEEKLQGKSYKAGGGGGKPKKPNKAKQNTPGK